MAKTHLLSMEQIEELRKSQHILHVTETTINYSAKFKEHVYNEYKEGKSYEIILWEAGIDPDILGVRRLNSLRTMVQKEGKRKEGFTDKSSRLTPRTLSERLGTTDTVRITQLEQELAYTRQELEYLKKIYLAGMEEQKACITKRHRKSNSELSET